MPVTSWEQRIKVLLITLIRKTLNIVPGTAGSSACHTPSPAPKPIIEVNADFEGSGRLKAASVFPRRSFQATSSCKMDGEHSIPQPRLDRRYSVCDRVVFGHRRSDYRPSNFRPSDYRASDARPSDYRASDFSRCSDDDISQEDSPSTVLFSPMSCGGFAHPDDVYKHPRRSRYCLVVSKQMVGIFLTVWIRKDLRDHVRNVKVSCVGRGLMGYLGNKGSISVSMLLHEISFCFVCSHLTSGQKEGDELRRTTSFRDFSRRIIGRTLMCLILFLAVEFGGSWLALMVLGTPRVSSIMVEKLIEESLGVDDLGEKIRVMEKGLERFGLGREISSCGTKNSTWKIDQDGLLLNSRCTFHKSTAEEVNMWGWPFHNSGLLTTGSSSRWMAVISGRIIEWENGGIGSQVARNAGSTWVLEKWSSSAVQFEPNTWVLEYRRNSLLENPRFFSAVGDFLKSVVSVFIRRARKEFWFMSCMNDHCGGGTSMGIPRASHIPT